MTCPMIKEGHEIDTEYCETLGEGKGCNHIKVCKYYLEQKEKEGIENGKERRE